jgi:uncharacterized membrane-anchored protein
MCCALQSYPTQKRVNLLSFVVIVGACFVSGLATAQESSPPLVPQPVHWTSGPSQAAIGSVGGFEIPRGYRFADSRAGRTMLESLHQQVPEGLVGILSPASGEWVMALSYSAAGYVKDSAAKFDNDALLKSVWDETSAANKARAESKLPAIVHVNWALKPAYDADTHVLQWAVRQDTVSDREKSTMYIGRLLGRHGFIQGIVVSRDISDFDELKKLFFGASFKQGDRYADFKPGDHAADFEFARLVAKDPTASTVNDSAWASAWLWVGAGTGVLTALVLAIVVVRGRKTQKRAFDPEKAPQPKVAHAPAHRNGAKAAKMNIATAISTNGHSHLNGNGHSNGHVKINGNGDGKKRRMFNYQKFYTEMMLQGPSPVSSDSYVRLAGQNGANGDNGQHSNGESTSAPHTNGNGNGNGHGHLNGKSESNGSNVMVHAQAEIIAGQKSLIEDQKRFIQEQTRLIEEKTRLISEKTALLHKQSEMIDHNLL